jgi:exosome complex RNA-binding protein Csl4
MFGLVSRSFRPKGSKSSRNQNRNRVRLSFEALESRYCLSAPSITGFNAVVETGHTILLSGTVSDSNPGTVALQFSGVAAGTTSADSTGHFQLETTAANLGMVYAVASDSTGASSMQAQTMLSTPSPQVTLNLTQNAGTSVTLSGQVFVNTPGGLTITFSGQVSGTVVTNSNGTFSYTANAAGLGSIYAKTTDVWGQTSNTAQVSISSTPPTISLTVSQRANQNVYVSGKVTDESPANLTVSLTGVVSGTATTASDGSFSYTGPASALGKINASVTDPWGQTGTGSTTLTNVAPQITNFQAINLGQNMFTFEGQVMDEWAPGLTVQLSGLLGVNTSVTVANDDWFTYTTTLQANQAGYVSAVTTDWWGLQSNTDQVWVVTT